MGKMTKWQSCVCMCVCVCVRVCVFSDVWSLSLNNIWRSQDRTWNKTSSSDQSASFIAVEHARTHARNEAFWHFKNGSDGKWDCGRQSGKCHRGDCSLLLIKQCAIKNVSKWGKRKGGEREKWKELSGFSFLCKTARKKKSVFSSLDHLLTVALCSQNSA